MSASKSLYEATLAGRLEIYNAWLAAGKGSPFIYPWDTLPALYLFFGIVVRPHLSPPLARISGYVTFAVILVHSAQILLTRRCLSFAGGYGVGLATIWGVIMTGVLLLLHEPEKDFIRLEIREAAAAMTYTQTPEGVSYSINKDEASKELLKNRQVNGITQTFEPSKSKQSRSAPPYRLIWQPFPNTALHCIDWTIDFMTSFRGPNWNNRIATLPPIETLPPLPGYKTTRAIKGTILANETNNPSVSTSPSFDRTILLTTAKLYLAVDLVKTVMITDPYFLGLRPLASPSPWPYLKSHTFSTRTARLGISLFGVISWLSLIFSLSPLCYYTLLSKFISQKTLLKITRAPLYDPRMYAPQFLPLYGTVAAGGLAHFWGQSWHQMFRYGMSEPSKPLVRMLSLHPKSQSARAVSLLVAFAISGTIHAVAAFTTFSVIPAKPWFPWLFFVSQAVGIIIQTALVGFLTKTLKVKASDTVKKTGNIAFTVMWLFITGPLLANDFARAGVWLFEPIPFSIFRGLTGQGWWHWRGTWVGWWKHEVFGWGVAIF